MRIRVINHLDDLADDLRAIPAQSVRDMRAVVREGIRVGNTVARDYARQSSGKHGKHYPRAFSAEMHGMRGGFGVNLISGEYGPDAAKRQGNMSFEGGSRNQPPHNDLAKSADLIGPAFHGEVHRLPSRWFW